MNPEYEAGRRFEYKVRDHLEGLGYVVMRAAGSKGDLKADLIALHPIGPMLLVQCKRSGKITGKEWDRLYEISEWHAACVPLVASNGPNGRGVEYTRITGERVRYARTQPCQPYTPGEFGP